MGGLAGGLGLNAGLASLVAGVVLNRLMILFIFAPIGLVFWNYLNLSMVV